MHAEIQVLKHSPVPSSVTVTKLPPTFVLEFYHVDYTAECSGSVTKLLADVRSGKVKLPEAGGYVKKTFAGGDIYFVLKMPKRPNFGRSSNLHTSICLHRTRRVWQHRTSGSRSWTRYLQHHADKLTQALETLEARGCGDKVNTRKVLLDIVDTNKGKRRYEVDISKIPKIDSSELPDVLPDPDSIDKKNYGKQTLLGSKITWRHVRTFLEYAPEIASGGDALPVAAARSPNRAAVPKHLRNSSAVPSLSTADLNSTAPAGKQLPKTRRVWQHSVLRANKWENFPPRQTELLTIALEARNRGGPAQVLLPEVTTKDGPRRYVVNIADIPPTSEQPVGQMPPKKHYGRQWVVGHSMLKRRVRTFEVYNEVKNVSETHALAANADNPMLADVDLHMHRVAQEWVDQSINEARLGTGIDHKTKQRGYFALSVVKVKQVVNQITLRGTYELTRKDIQQKMLQQMPICHRQPVSTVGEEAWAMEPKLQVEPDCNEKFLFHGCGAKTLDLIVANGFDKDYSSLRGLFGAGCYFAQDPAKADQYSTPLSLEQKQQYGIVCDNEVYAIFAARVCLGAPAGSMEHPITCGLIKRGIKKVVAGADSLWRKAGAVYKDLGQDVHRCEHSEHEKGRVVHSIIGRGLKSHHAFEFVTYDRNCQIPEYVFFYERRFSGPLTHNGELLLQCGHPRVSRVLDELDGWYDFLQRDVLKGGKVVLDCAQLLFGDSGAARLSSKAQLVWRWRAPRQLVCLSFEKKQIHPGNKNQRVSMHPVWFGARLGLRLCFDDGVGFMAMLELWVGTDGVVRCRGCYVLYLRPGIGVIHLERPNRPLFRRLTSVASNEQHMPQTSSEVKWMTGTWLGRQPSRLSKQCSATGSLEIALPTIQLIQQHLDNRTLAPKKQNVAVRMAGELVRVTKCSCHGELFSFQFELHGVSWIGTLCVMANPMRFHGCFARIGDDAKTFTGDCGVWFGADNNEGMDASTGWRLHNPYPHTSDTPTASDAFATGELEDFDATADTPALAHLFDACTVSGAKSRDLKSDAGHDDAIVGPPPLPRAHPLSAAALTDEEVQSQLKKVMDLALDRGLIRPSTYDIVLQDIAAHQTDEQKR